jgi:hypothetical protein
MYIQLGRGVNKQIMDEQFKDDQVEVLVEAVDNSDQLQDEDQVLDEDEGRLIIESLESFSGRRESETTDYGLSKR